MKLFKTCIYALLLVFALGFGSAHAASTDGGDCSKPSPDVAALTSIADSLKSQLNGSVLNTFASVATGLSGGLVPIGSALGGAILLISLLSSIAKAMTSQKPVGGVVLDHVITGAIIAAILGNYGTFVSFVVDLANSLNNAVGGSSPFAAISDFALRFFTIIGTVTTSAFKGIACLGLFSEGVVGLIIDALLTLLLLMIAIVLVLLALADLLFALLLGPVVLGVGIVYGPIAIGAGLASPFTKGWFDKWVGFMSAAAIMQFVAYTVLKLLDGVITSVGNVGTSSVGQWYAAQALGIALIALMAGKIFEQIPGMANALVPSTTGTNGNSGGEGMKNAATSAVGMAAAGIGGVAAANAAGKGYVSAAAHGALAAAKKAFSKR